MRIRSIARGSILLFALLATLAGPATPAAASRLLLSEEAVAPNAEIPPFFPPPDGQIEGACGVAISGNVYVSDYYHHAVDVFGANTTIPAGAPSGPCGLATSSSGALYANIWHQSVVRLLPTATTIESGEESTGVAVDQASGNVYVNDRTHVAVYTPAGTLVQQIGLPDSLGDAYGVAVFGGKVYVPDAADNTVKVFEPAVKLEDPVTVIDGSATPQAGFNSLVDAAVAVDPTNGHLLVLDNLQPGFAHPEAAIDEFDAAGKFLGQLADTVVDGEPSGLAFSGASLYATSGNDEEANVFLFGPYAASGAEPFAPLSAPSSSTMALATGGAQSPPRPTSGRSGRPPHAVSSEVVQHGQLRVSFDGRLTPHALPRHGSAPVKVEVAARIAATSGGPPPQLRQISIAINRNGHFTPKGLPVCHLRDIQPATTANALKACRGALVGEGHFSAKILLAQQAPFPSEGKVFAFNGSLHGKPAILAHVYGTDPVPTSYTLPFAIEPAKGTYGTVLHASLPGVTGDSGYITGLSLTLGRRFSYHGRQRSYLSAGCPAPSGFPGAVFPFARASFGFGGRTLVSTLTRSCGVRG
jgi:DNA-binding beta-propeller fold protein YncE